MSQHELSTVKKFAVKTLECFDTLAKPEIQNRVVLKIWEYIRNYTFRIILKKPDEELQKKLFEVYKTLGPLFNDTEMSVEIQKGEALGSVKIPNVGKLAEIKKLTNSKAEDILRELKL